MCVCVCEEGVLEVYGEMSSPGGGFKGEGMADGFAGDKFWESEKRPGRVGGDDGGGWKGKGREGKDAFRIWPNC
jgi:hypothetical protein